MDVLEDAPRNQIDELRRTIEIVRQNSDSATPLRPLDDEELKRSVDAEIAQGAILFDRDGFSNGAREAIFGRTREYLQKFADVKRKFSDRYQPFDARSRERDAIPGAIKQLEADRDRAIAAEKSRLDRDRVGEDFLATKAKFDRQIATHAHRPNLKAVSSRFPFDVNPVYFLIMVLLGIAEWFINYDTLFLFFGVPIIAFGATVVLAACLAVIAHQHGVDLKQWKKKFGPAVEDRERPYGPLVLATIGLVGLITVVGWMRYQAVMGVLQAHSTASILGTQYSVAIDPTREVVISLGANVLAWLVGVFISFFAHDADPVYVETALDFAKADRKYQVKRREFERKEQQLKHKYADEIEGETNRLKQFEGDPLLKEAEALKSQVEEHEQGFRERARLFILAQYSRYRTELLKALAQHQDVSLYRFEQGKSVPITLTDYRGLAVSVADDLLDRIGQQEARP
ncbi:MAG TPA: hypothetical protein VMF53_10915 [Alphaproteobacteria bacterium]|nr:hypothetical protein [Alphaproteobacteria bacterium]